MKKLRLLSILSLSAVLAGCTEKIVEPESNPAEEPDAALQTITVGLPDEVVAPDGTKVSFTQGTDKLILNWAEGDEVTLIGQTTETYKLISGAGTKTAVFEGKEVVKPENGDYTVIYPSTFTTDEAFKAGNYEGQKQNGNGNTSHLKFHAMTTSSTTDFSFSGEDVTVNGAMKLQLKLPASLTNPTSITVSAESAIFYKTNDNSNPVSEMKLDLENITLDQDNMLTAYLMTSPQTVEIAEGAKLTFTVESTIEEIPFKYIKTITPGALSLTAGKVNVFKLNADNWKRHSGSGTEADPYLLCAVEDLQAMSSLLVSHQKVWFKLMNDIDMDSIDNWVPLNTGNDLSREIDFNGNYKTIKNFKSSNRVYASFFGVLFGKCYDLTFENPVVKNDGMNSSCAVVGGYVGTEGYPATVERVNIKGGSVTCSTDTGNVPVGAVAGNVNGGSQIIDCNVEGIEVNSSAAMTGGIAGRLRTAADKIANCTFNGTITTSNSVVGGIVGEVEIASVITGCKTAGEIVKAGEKSGGIVGNHAGNGLIEIEKTVSGIKVTGSNYCGGFVGMQANSSSQIKITNSISSGDINCTGQHIGGFVGEAKQNVTVQNCLTTGNITGNWTVGGICGRANNASWTVSTANLNIVVEKCLVWSPAIKVLTRNGSDGGGSGIICGFTSPYNTLKSCFHSSSLVFEGRWPGDTDKDPVDQEDADAENPLRNGTSATGAGGTYVYPYWGKTYNGTASAKATELGWDTSVWNLSGEVPVLE
ncbi:MAG: hypothetical protein MR784_06470 [Rikenellaceae bacterium]|nr:hypothetical protein [Rikenellaceae bacterium]